MIRNVENKPSLDGYGVLVTRPAEQARTLADLIRQRGGHPILFPAIDIQEVTNVTRLNAVIDRLDTFDVAIFISPNAASRGLRAVRTRRELPPALKVVAIGGGTARELQRQGISAVIVPPERFDSESLLSLPELQHLRGQRVVIFRGEGGRALLGDTLVTRGASVEYAECYRRAKSVCDVEPLVQAWSRGEVQAVIVTSSEGLRNLYELIGDAGRTHLMHTPVFAPHPRIASTARELGLSATIVTAPGDVGLVNAIAHHFAASR
ncbi:MAG: uroporphyrinogen-III synthase [Betaproteobacteria bacterium]